MKRAHYHEVGKQRFPSGISLIHVRVPNIPYSAAAAFVHSGSRFDPVGSEGLAHFFEHLLGMRTERHSSSEERLRVLEESGIDFYAETNHERIALIHTQPAEKTDASIRFLLEALFSSVYDESDVNREKRVIKNEAQASKQEPMRRLWWAATPALWPGSLLSRRVLGNDDSLAKITLSKLQSFQKEYVTPERINVVIIEPDVLNDDRQKVIERILGDAKFKSGAGKKVSYKDDTGKKPKAVTLLEDGGEDQATLGLFFRTVPATDFRNRLLCSFLRDYLGGTWTSRLVQRLRMEENTTYWVDADVEYFMDTGSLEYTLSLSRESLPRILAAMFDELDRCKSNLVDKKTLEMVKNGKVYTMKKNILTPNFLLEWYGEDSVFDNNGQIVTIEHYIDELNSVTSHEIREAAQTFFDRERIALVALGIPKEEQQELSKDVKQYLKTL